MYKDFPGGSERKAAAYNAGDLGSALGWEDLLEKERQPTPVLLPGKSHGQRNLVGSMGSVHGVSKSRTSLSDFTFTFIPICRLVADWSTILYI